MPLEETRRSMNKRLRNKWQTLKSVTYRVRPNHKKLNKSSCSTLKPGDHIAWLRPYVIYHHAIVYKVVSANEVKVFHYQLKGLTFEIVKKKINFEKQLGEPYLIVYPKEVTDKNNADLVIARARSRLRETKYKLTKNNCESFATFCKTGESVSYQVDWFRSRAAVYFFISNLRPSFAITAVPALAVISYALGALFAILAEICFVCIDIRRMNNQRKNGDFSHEVYDEMVTQRIIEAICSSTLAIGGGIGGGEAGICIGSKVPVWTFLFRFIFGDIGYIVLGIAGTILGYIFASTFGPFIGKAVTPHRRFNDIAVDISDIDNGDHIIVNASILHKQCHAIVVSVHPPNKIHVIRNAFRKGVVEETVKFKKPVYKALYGEESTLSPDVVIRRAKSKIGEREISYFKCKQFALWCKELDKKESENIESINTNDTRPGSIEDSNRDLGEIEAHI